MAPSDEAQAGSGASHGPAASGSPHGSENAAEHSAAAAKQGKAAPEEAASATALAEPTPAVAPSDEDYEIRASSPTKQPSHTNHVRADVSDDGSLVFDGDPHPNSSADSDMGISRAGNEASVRLVGFSTDLHLHDLSHL